MSTIEITLPDDLRDAVDEQITSGRFASRSEYFRALIEGDQRRRAIESRLVERLNETEEVVMDSADIAKMRDTFSRGRA